jgi:hypothetical protein
MRAAVHVSGNTPLQGTLTKPALDIGLAEPGLAAERIRIWNQRLVEALGNFSYEFEPHVHRKVSRARWHWQ